MLRAAMKADKIFDFKTGFCGQSLPPRERPLIAISANVMGENSALHSAYSEAIIAAGALPMIVPHTLDAADIRSLVREVDGVLFSGGADFDSRYFGAENIEGLTEYDTKRDYHEFMLLRAAIDRGVPLLGICRGFQLFNIALGGDIYQDLGSEYPTQPLNHSVLIDRHLGVHEVRIKEGSLLRSILQCDTIKVNSRHHQALKNIAPELTAVAQSEDGVIEALEGYPNHKIIGVQWHPENMAGEGDSLPMQRLFSFFVGEAALFRRAKKLHQQNPIVDSHCDTPMLYETGGFDLCKRDSRAKVDIIKMGEGELDATITVAYLPQSTPAEIAPERAIEILERFIRDVEAYPDRATIARSVEELLEAKRKNLRAVMLGVENGLAIGSDLRNLERLKALGVQYITLCHNGSNQICDSAAGEPLYGGVSEFGRKVIQRMNELSLTIDVSHSSHNTTMEVVRLSQQPIIASHSSCKGLCDHRRNLSDEAMMAIAARGGVIQICGYGGFLAEGREATIHDIVAHIEYAVERVGYDHVGVGSDFDGDGGVSGFDGANEYLCLTVELLRREHSETNVAKIMGGNVLRVLENNRK